MLHRMRKLVARRADLRRCTRSLRRHFVYHKFSERALLSQLPDSSPVNNLKLRRKLLILKQRLLRRSPTLHIRARGAMSKIVRLDRVAHAYGRRNRHVTVTHLAAVRKRARFVPRPRYTFSLFSCTPDKNSRTLRSTLLQRAPHQYLHPQHFFKNSRGVFRTGAQICAARANTFVRARNYVSTLARVQRITRNAKRYP
jgi:hypothetical protein